MASGITQDLKDRADALKAKGIVPTLAVLRVGEKADDLSYEKGIFSRCAKAGIEIKHIVLAQNASKEEILGEIRKINEDSAIHGCLMFRPLADKETEAEAVKLLAPEKDMDAMTPSSMATVFLGTGDGYAPCTAQSCIEILKHYGVNLTGANVVVVGRSPVIGKPVSMLLQKENATVTMCHTKTVSMAEICRKADVLVVAAGKAGVVDSDFVREGQVVIDVGINVDAEGKLCGDVDFASVEPVVKAITPVPGGVGSVTTSILASHLIEAAEKCAK